jgi:hypothetical protein
VGHERKGASFCSKQKRRVVAAVDIAKFLFLGIDLGNEQCHEAQFLAYCVGITEKRG